MPRADVGAVTALDALAHIDLSQVVNNRDGIDRAFTLALHAADAADLAHLHDLRALVVAAAGWHDLLFFGNQLNNALRAGIHAGAAADTVVAVNLGNTIDNMHGIKLAGFGTVSETNAGEGTELAALTAEKHGCTTVFRSVVVETEFRRFE